MSFMLFAIISASIPSGWPMFKANEQRTGYVSGHSHFSDSAEKKWDLLIQNSEADIIYSNPVSADFTGDGKNDILIGSFGFMFPVADLYNGPDGAVIWTTIDTISIGPFFCTPALMDINGDGKPEVFESVAESAWLPAPQGYFKALNGADGTLLWKKKIMYCDSMWSGIQGGYCAPLVIDADSGTVITGDDFGILRAFNATNGNLRWADTLTVNLLSPSRGDVDNDGNKEIIVVAGATLYAITDSGNLKWSIPIGDSATTPVLANLDADPEFEIIVYCYLSGTIKAFNSNNSTPFINVGVGPFTPDWSPETAGPTPWLPSPSVAKITGDNTPDIVIHNGKSLICVNGATGAQEWNKTYSNLFGSPVTADLNNDGNNEIVVTGLPPDTGYRAQVYCFSNGGDKMWGWNSPRAVGGYRDPILNEACLTDVDADGDLEIAVADYSCYCAVLDIPGGAVEENGSNATSRYGGMPDLTVVNNKILLSMPNSENVELKLYDLCGRMRETIYKGSLSKGTYTFAPKIKVSGIYFVTLTAGQTKETRKLILIR